MGDIKEKEVERLYGAYKENDAQEGASSHSLFETLDSLSPRHRGFRRYDSCTLISQLIDAGCDNSPHVILVFSWTILVAVLAFRFR